MRTERSVPQRQSASATLEDTDNASTSPMILGGGSLLVLALVRIFVGYLWFQQLFWKLPPDFAGLRAFSASCYVVGFAFRPGARGGT